MVSLNERSRFSTRILSFFVALTASACAPEDRAQAAQSPAEPDTPESVALPSLPSPPSPDTAYARSLSAAFRDASNLALPSVVFISVEREGVTAGVPVPIPDLFRRFFEMPSPDTPLPPMVGSGSGFIFDEEGHIITNHHVVADATRIGIRTHEGREFEAELVGSDAATDIALLRVDTGDEELPRAPLGDSGGLQIGDWVLALGNPLGLEFTVTSGIVSAKGRQLTGRALAVESYIQTDAAINPGNSGGPLVDLSGRVVGVNTAIFGSDRFVGYGFAVPIELALEVVEDLLEYGYARRPRLGIRVSDVTAVDAEVYGLEAVRGAEVNAIDTDSPAEGLLEIGDVLLALDGEPIDNANALVAGLAQLDPGDVVELRVQRDGEERRVRVELGEFAREGSRVRPVSREAEVEELLGFRIEALTPEVARRLGHERESGIVIGAVRPYSEAARAGAEAGQLLLELNGRPVRSLSAFEEMAEDVEEGDVVSLRVIDSDIGETILNYRIRAR